MTLPLPAAGFLGLVLAIVSEILLHELNTGPITWEILASEVMVLLVHLLNQSSKSALDIDHSMGGLTRVYTFLSLSDLM